VELVCGGGGGGVCGRIAGHMHAHLVAAEAPCSF
jgi:hypothetical protein